jgi:hypothetical protein
MRVIVILISALLCTACANMYGGVGVSNAVPKSQEPAQ